MPSSSFTFLNFEEKNLYCEASYLSLHCTATFVILTIAPCCWPFLSTFLPPLPFLDLYAHNPPILAVAFLVPATSLLLYLRSFR